MSKIFNSMKLFGDKLYKKYSGLTSTQKNICIGTSIAISICTVMGIYYGIQRSNEQKKKNKNKNVISKYICNTSNQIIKCAEQIDKYIDKHLSIICLNLITLISIFFNCQYTYTDSLLNIYYSFRNMFSLCQIIQKFISILPKLIFYFLVMFFILLIYCNFTFISL